VGFNFTVFSESTQESCYSLIQTSVAKAGNNFIFYFGRFSDNLTLVWHLFTTAMSNPNGLLRQKLRHYLNQGRTLNGLL